MVGAAVEPRHLLRDHADAARAPGRGGGTAGGDRGVHRLRLGTARLLRAGIPTRPRARPPSRSALRRPRDHRRSLRAARLQGPQQDERALHRHGRGGQPPVVGIGHDGGGTGGHRAGGAGRRGHRAAGLRADLVVRRPGDRELEEPSRPRGPDHRRPRRRGGHGDRRLGGAAQRPGRAGGGAHCPLRPASGGPGPGPPPGPPPGGGRGVGLFAPSGRRRRPRARARRRDPDAGADAATTRGSQEDRSC